MTRASVRATRSTVTVGSSALVEAGGLRARRGMADEDQRVVLGPPAALGRQAAQPVEALVAELVVGPLGGRADGHRGRRRSSTGRRPRSRSRRPRCRCCPGRSSAPSASSARRRRRRAAGSGPLRTRSPATRTASGFSRAMSARTASRRRALPWTSDRAARASVIAQHALAGGMMKLIVASQATSPSTLATPRPRPKRRPSFSIVTSSRSVSPGLTIRLKRHSSMPANSPIRSPNPGCLAT